MGYMVIPSKFEKKIQTANQTIYKSLSATVTFCRIYWSRFNALANNRPIDHGAKQCWNYENYVALCVLMRFDFRFPFVCASSWTPPPPYSSMLPQSIVFLGKFFVWHSHWFKFYLSKKKHLLLGFFIEMDETKPTFDTHHQQHNFGLFLMFMFNIQKINTALITSNDTHI